MSDPVALQRGHISCITSTKTVVSQLKQKHSVRREKEAYKAMAIRTLGVHTWINHTGSIWENAKDIAHRRLRPDATSPKIDTLPAGQPLTILCYSLGTTEEFINPLGIRNTSNAWDFVVTSDQDSGGYVADVYVNNDGDIAQQLGEQGRCNALKQRLANS